MDGTPTRTGRGGAPGTTEPGADGDPPAQLTGSGERDFADHGRETPKERRDRELIELLNELRLAAPGVQVTFGFLLIVPFQGRFQEATTFERAVYGASLMLVALSAVLILGAAVQHRMLFRRHFEQRMLVTVSWLAFAGLTLLGLGMVGSVLFVTHYLFGTPLSVLLTCATTAAILAVWYALPLQRLLSTSDD